jgi:hypothetical protein
MKLTGQRRVLNRCKRPKSSPGYEGRRRTFVAGFRALRTISGLETAKENEDIRWVDPVELANLQALLHLLVRGGRVTSAVLLAVRRRI